MEFRTASIEDLPDIVKLLADDALGQTRETYLDPLPDEYIKAFEAMEKQEGNQIILAVDNGEVVGCLQLTFIPTIARGGMTRAQIEGVRVKRSHRKKGIGQAMFEEAIRLAREYGCVLVQLTTDKKRTDAHGFYERLGFKVTHEGIKLDLSL
ncbi:GNAT family N-acetyltransferase [Salinicoccus sp. HZC-1]|uniref:GNAT family N-acetyltransferase n=1 Tax=Salinicoccus sp. HZC-1 TaxID=3385497 RepID=UPI00398A6EFC